MATIGPWDGRDRRKVTDHDTIIELVQIIKNHVENFESHRESYKDHIKDDSSKFEELRIALEGIKRVIWIGLGVFMTLQGIPKIIDTIQLLHKAGG